MAAIVAVCALQVQNMQTDERVLTWTDVKLVVD